MAFGSCLCIDFPVVVSIYMYYILDACTCSFFLHMFDECAFVKSMSSDQFASAECQKEAIPFLCLFGFPLCSCTHNEIYLPSKDDCERIIAESCRVEYIFLLASGSDYINILPDCNLLPMANQYSEGLIVLDVNLTGIYTCLNNE